MNTEVTNTVDITAATEAETNALGRKLGAALRGGEVIELVGDVGAGKTTFVKGIAAGLGVDEDIQSPTFTLSRMYESPRGVRLAHYDFYRLQDPGIMSAELYETANDKMTATIIEWAEIVGGVLPQDHLTIQITAPTETSRVFRLQPGGPVSRGLVEAMK